MPTLLQLVAAWARSLLGHRRRSGAVAILENDRRVLAPFVRAFFPVVEIQTFLLLCFPVSIAHANHGAVPVPNLFCRRRARENVPTNSYAGLSLTLPRDIPCIALLHPLKRPRETE